MNFTPDAWAWGALLASVAFMAGYEVWLLRRGRMRPELFARSANAQIRAAWVENLQSQPGFEIVAVQTLRNSLMSATIVASTAALALLGTISLASASFSQGILVGGVVSIPPRRVIELLLMLTLFASFVSSSMAMRFYNHAGFIMSMPAGSPGRTHFNPMALAYVQRAGLHYSWGLRFFLLVAPLMVGVVNTMLMPWMTLALVLVLNYFDRPALPGSGPAGD
jgi:hypothetical protein